jgi:hypothetical protein
MNFETASQARYIDPRLCPSMVNFGHVASSTRYLELRDTKCSDSGERVMSNLDWWGVNVELSGFHYMGAKLTLTLEIICSLVASTSPVYTTLITSGSVR